MLIRRDSAATISASTLPTRATRRHVQAHAAADLDQRLPFPRPHVPLLVNARTGEVQASPYSWIKIRACRDDPVAIALVMMVTQGR